MITVKTGYQQSKAMCAPFIGQFREAGCIVCQSTRIIANTIYEQRCCVGLLESAPERGR